jgi:hypothetical protein
MIRGRPFQITDCRDQPRLEPTAFFHLRYRQFFAPLTATRRAQIGQARSICLKSRNCLNRVVRLAVEAMIAQGRSPRDAALEAMDEVGGALVGIAQVLPAVFIPVPPENPIRGDARVGVW